MGEDEHVRCGEAAPSQRIARHLQRVVRPPLRSMHTSQQLHHNLQLHIRVPFQLRGLVRRARPVRPGPVRLQAVTGGLHFPMAKRVAVVRGEPETGNRHHPRQEILHQVRAVLQTGLLCGRALLSDHA